MSNTAKLRVCASCEWIYKGDRACPKCGFASYAAYHVYGKPAYRYARTQEPWVNKKVQKYREELINEVCDNLE